MLNNTWKKGLWGTLLVAILALCVIYVLGAVTVYGSSSDKYSGMSKEEYSENRKVKVPVVFNDVPMPPDEFNKQAMARQLFTPDSNLAISVYPDGTTTITTPEYRAMVGIIDDKPPVNNDVRTSLRREGLNYVKGVPAVIGSVLGVVSMAEAAPLGHNCPGPYTDTSPSYSRNDCGGNSYWLGIGWGNSNLDNVSGPCTNYPGDNASWNDCIWSAVAAIRSCPLKYWEHAEYSGGTFTIWAGAHVHSFYNYGFGQIASSIWNYSGPSWC